MDASTPAFALLLAFMLGLVLAIQPAAAAAATISPASGEIGTVFTINGSGFQSGERVNLTTVDPKEAKLDASYVVADPGGNFTVKVFTTDPDGLAATAGGNYTNLKTDYDSDGNVLDQYLQLILFKPSLGTWSLSATGISSGMTQAYNFTLASPAGSATASSSPTSGPMGTIFTLNAGGFLPGERVDLWTTDPNNKALDASYLLADQNGNIMIQVDSSDPNGAAAAAGGNFTDLRTDYDSNGLVLDQYLQVILFDHITGGWHLTAQSATNGATQVFSFNITQ
jgi:hypothetical protein